MKIDISKIDRENFMVHENVVGDEPVYLVQPVHVGAQWSKDNLIFRSSVWSKDGDPVSLSWKKFANFGEKPEVFDVPSSLTGCEAMEKIDGSTLIVSRYKGNLIVRTRGTVDASKLDNGHEIEVLKQKYPKVFDNGYLEDSSIVLEWCSPTNRIILDYGSEPILYLTGIIRHSNYRYVSQNVLDHYAAQWGVLRPRRYKFDTLEQLQASVKEFRGVEGVCLYFNEGQDITKIKGLQYLMLHRAKSDVGSIDKVIDLYFGHRKDNGSFLSFDEFYDFIATSFDYEIAEIARGHIKNICDGMQKVSEIEIDMIAESIYLKSLSRRDAAAIVLKEYGSVGRASFVFQLLDGKQWSVESYKKLLGQVLNA